MHFGKVLGAQKYKPWEEHYLDYIQLKLLLEQGRKDKNDERSMPQSVSASSHCLSSEAASVAFTSLFESQAQQVVYFFLRQQGTISQKLYQLCRSTERHSRSVDPEEIDDFHKALWLVASELLHLVEFVDLNVTAIRKILKKHDRVVGGKRLSSKYLSQSSNLSGCSVILDPLFEHGGLDCMIKTLEESFRWLDATHGEVLRSENFNESLQWIGYGSDYEQMSQRIPRDKLGKDVLSAIDVARWRLRKSRDFVNMLAAQLLIEIDESGEPAPERSRKRRLSNWLNFLSTFLHLADYYVVAPGCGTYAEKLGGDASMAGIIIGMNSVAALLSTVIYSWWTNSSYKAPLMCATICQITGLVVYASALPMGSLRMVIIGRFISGFGSARALNRRYIADTYSSRERTGASAAFVTAGALGTSFGPAFAAILYSVVADPSPHLFWQVETAPCWLMTVIWIGYFACLNIFFEDPPRKYAGEDTTRVERDAASGEEAEVLLKQSNSRFSVQPASAHSPSVQPLWCNIPVMSTFVIYFVLKFILESLLASTATLTRFYFDWDGNHAGAYLAILGLLVLPANWIVTILARHYDDRELMLGIECIMLVGCLSILNYYSSTYLLIQYMTGSIVIFVSTNALEGPTMSLLSKTIPPVYSRGLLNVGLLATESGTLGRAVGDVILTMCGASGLEYVLNNAFGGMSVLSIAAIVVTSLFYRHLEPTEKES